MSETHPTFVPCASGNNVFTDCLVVRFGNLVRLVGHAQMDFTSKDAKDLAYSILELLDHPYREATRSAVTTLDDEASSGDAIVDEAIAMLRARSKLGQEKYGTTLMRNDLTLFDWMQYAVEESLDRTLYELRALKDLKQLYDDGR